MRSNPRRSGRVESTLTKSDPRRAANPLATRFDRFSRFPFAPFAAAYARRRYRCCCAAWQAGPAQRRPAAGTPRFDRDSTAASPCGCHPFARVLVRHLARARASSGQETIGSVAVVRYSRAMSESGAHGGRGESAARPPRVWVSVHFRCCNVYQRVYFARGAVEAVGRCPSCLREIRFRLDENAEPGRFFSAEA